jgi:prepilin-type N-terminal cleavage/methylation domain-containing protein
MASKGFFIVSVSRPIWGHAYLDMDINVYKMRNSNKAFTLLELIIVIIVVGVLASLALPRFFRTIEFSRGTEALNALGALRRSIERCSLFVGGDYSQCQWNNLDIDDPGTSPGAHFIYVYEDWNSTVDSFTVTAYRNALDGGVSMGLGGDIRLTMRPGGTVVHCGRGPFAGIGVLWPCWP